MSTTRIMVAALAAIGLSMTGDGASAARDNAVRIEGQTCWQWVFGSATAVAQAVASTPVEFRVAFLRWASILAAGAAILFAAPAYIHGQQMRGRTPGMMERGEPLPSWMGGMMEGGRGMMGMVG